jgi:PBP1b-binding outer membrane lipoprotein LpoB
MLKMNYNNKFKTNKMKNIFILIFAVILVSCSSKSGVAEENVTNDSTAVLVDTTVVTPAEVDSTVK